MENKETNIDKNIPPINQNNSKEDKDNSVNIDNKNQNDSNNPNIPIDPNNPNEGEKRPGTPPKEDPLMIENPNAAPHSEPEASLYEEEFHFNPEFALTNTQLKNKIHLQGKKGHYTYYTEELISVGNYYFEVEIISTDYDMVKHIKAKMDYELFFKTKFMQREQGKYYDVMIQNIKMYSPTVRIGIVDENCDLGLPIGSNGNTYCYRSRDGALLKRGEAILGNEVFKTGDVIGCLVHLKPPKPEFIKKEDEKKDTAPVEDDECYIKFYYNGEEQEKYTTIPQGNYRLGVTLYNFPIVELNFTKELKKDPKLNGIVLNYFE
ncbi:MAG: hypothetical protein MJ252_18345 [archaeon]|nr:hypothetical protein [archaeon]